MTKLTFSHTLATHSWWGRMHLLPVSSCLDDERRDPSPNLSPDCKARKSHIDGLVQERRNPSALAMELRLSCINPQYDSKRIPLFTSHLVASFALLHGQSLLPKRHDSSALVTDLYLLYQHIKGWTKWVIFCIHIQLHFFTWKLVHFDWNCTEVCS